MVKCELALEGAISREYHNHEFMLLDDEELELQELEVGPNPLRCSDRFTANGVHGFSLYKGWFWRFSDEVSSKFC
nr:homeobox-ddt domain protein rlt3 [Quercus suber]